MKMKFFNQKRLKMKIENEISKWKWKFKTKIVKKLQKYTIIKEQRKKKFKIWAFLTLFLSFFNYIIL